MQCTRDMVSSGRASPGEAMVAARRVITLSIDPDQCCALANIARSRTEATGRVERARIILALSRHPIGLRGCAADRGEPADRDAVPGAGRGIGGLGRAG